jgi:hypothetical protein
LRLFAAALSALAIFCYPAEAQFDGVPTSPHWAASQVDPLASVNIRMGIPAVIFGPNGFIGDTTPVFVPKAGGGFWMQNANQSDWVACMSTLTSYLGTGAVGLVDPCTGAAETNGQSVYTKTTSPQVTSYNTSSFKPGFVTAGISASYPGFATNECGNWVQSTYKRAGYWYKYVHNEGPCDYYTFPNLGYVNFNATAAASAGQATFAVPGAATGVVSGGSGYTSASPTFTGGTGSGATAHVNIVGGVVISVTIDNPGSGYNGGVNSTNGAPTFNLNGVGGSGASFGVPTTLNGQVVGFANGLLVGMEPYAVPNVSLAGTIASITGTNSGATVTMTSNLIAPIASGQTLSFNYLGFDTESSSMWKCSSDDPSSCSPMVASGVSNGTVISSLQPIKHGWLVGIGDCTMLPDDQGPIFMYAYCTNYSDSAVSDYMNVVARAPIDSLGPGYWNFLWNGVFTSPALNNQWNAAGDKPNADMYEFVASSCATMSSSAARTPYKVLCTDGKNHAYWHTIPENINGVNLAISLDYTTFTKLGPILNYDFQNFGGRNNTAYAGCVGIDPSGTCGDLYLYDQLHDGTDGGSVVNPKNFYHSTTWVAPNNDLGQRYLLMIPGVLTQMTIAQQLTGVPHIAIALETYLNTSSGKRRSTTVSPIAGPTSGVVEANWTTNGFLGYIMPACPNSLSVNECDQQSAPKANRIEECEYAAAEDWALNIDSGADGRNGSCPTGWHHFRTVGWLYSVKPTFPSYGVYSCYDSSTLSHFSSIDPSCNGKTVLNLLGYSSIN